MIIVRLLFAIFIWALATMVGVLFIGICSEIMKCYSRDLILGVIFFSGMNTVVGIVVISLIGVGFYALINEKFFE